MNAYLQYGTDGGPFRTERVEVRRRESVARVPRTGPIPSHYEVRAGGQWRRVWIGYGYGKGATFIKHGGERIAVQMED